MIYINSSIIEKNCDVIKQITNHLCQGLLQKIASLVLILSRASTVKATIKQTATNVLIGETILIKSSTVENDKNSLTVEYNNIAILLYLV